MTKQQIESLERQLGEVRIDLSFVRQASKDLNNEIINLKVALNDINIKINRDIIPYAATSAKTTGVLKNVEDILINIRGSIQDIYTKINYSTPKSAKTSEATPMDIDQKIESINKHQDDFLEKLQKKLETDNIMEKLTQNYLSTEQIKVMMDTSTQKILDKLPSTNLTTTNIPEILEIKNITSDVKTKLSSLEQGIIPKLSDMGDDIFKTNSKFTSLENGIDYLKIIIREPINQSETHRNLKEILRQIQLLNVDELNRQLTKLFRETLDQTDFSYKFAEAIKLEIRDRLVRIEGNLYKFISQNPSSQQGVTLNKEQIKQVTRETSLTTETYFIYTDGQAPDRPHFIK